MTTNFFLNWAVLSVSLINVMLLLWLGTMVLLNAEQRTRGVWLGSSGLLLGAAFFICHSAILGYGLAYDSYGLNLWWRLGWLPLAMIPFVWYLVALWYTDLWDEQGSFSKPHWYLTLLMGSCCLGLVLWLALASPLPSFVDAVQLDLSEAARGPGWPVFLILFPAYLFGCVGLALYSLWQTSPPEQVRDALGRKRAQPWLMGTSALLVLVSLLVVGAMIWLLKSATGPLSFQNQTNLLLWVAGFDLLIASFITTTVILLGQAVVSFEVFTEKTFPRREFQRQWRNAIILATGYSIVVGWGLTLQIRTIYILLVTTLLMTLFFALSSWRAYTWRDRYLRHLRPFITSQRLYDYLLAPVPSEMGVDLPFRALCEEVLRSQFAYLIPLGPLAPLVQPLSYPEKEKEPLTLPQGLIARFQSPEVICLPLEPQEAGGAVWAISLWSERGLIGLFLLGPKRDRGLYTQEEIEIAQASGERLIDTRASAEIAQQLMRLQRQRLVESQVLDRQTRRVLHDEVLPDLHTALLVLNGGGETAEAVKLLTEAHHQISTILRAMPAATAPQLERLGLIGALTHVVTDELKGAFEEVAWQIEPEARQVAEQLPSLPTTILFYATREAIRNAAKHGRNGHEDQSLRLNISISGAPVLTICVEDDGVGISSPMNAPSGGSGQGLALHSTMLAVIGGSLKVESAPGAYTRVTISCN